MSEIQLQPTQWNHVFMCDVDDSGLLKEIVVVKKFEDGSLYYIDVASLHTIDKSRIKKIITSQHADKYQCWELMSQVTLSNGLNALDFFHTNNVKVKRPKGAVASYAGLDTVGVYGDAIKGITTNPAEASLDPTNKTFAEINTRF